MRIAIRGAGIMGAWCALRLRERGHGVTLYHRPASAAASFAAAGLLCPFTELDTAESLITRLGLSSLESWRHLGEKARDFFFEGNGTLVVPPPSDRSAATRLVDRLRFLGKAESFELVEGKALAALEPELAQRHEVALYFPGEARLDPRAAWQSVRRKGEELGVTVVEKDIDEGLYDLVIDCRGLGAKGALPGLRGVRGERLTLQLARHSFRRTMRLADPVCPVYLSPLNDGRLIVGATNIESEDESPISARAILELLSAAYVIDPDLLEGHVSETVVGLRPALADNLPRIGVERGRLAVNGLYRHGYLVAPAVAAAVASWVEGEQTEFPELFVEEEASCRSA